MPGEFIKATAVPLIPRFERNMSMAVVKNQLEEEGFSSPNTLEKEWHIKKGGAFIRERRQEVNESIKALITASIILILSLIA